MKRLAILAALLVVALGGTAAAVATTTSTQEFTYTIPATTIPAQTYTQTVQIPTVTETVTTASATPGSEFQPWWTSTSFFRQPIPAGAALDPSSATWVNLLNNSASVNSIFVNQKAWSTTLYHAPVGTPTVTVAIGNTGKHIVIPFQSGWTASPDGDGHLAVIDDTTACEYEFQAFDPSTLTAHAAAVFHVDTGSGAHATDAGVTGGAMSVLGGLITPEDVASGAINHAMRLGTPVNGSGFRVPATSSDGKTSGGIPEGALVRLDPNLNLSTLGLTPFQTMLAKALQKYGAYDDDNSGSLAVYAQVNGTYALPITWLAKSLVPSLQVLAPLYSSVPLDTNTSAGCSNPF